MTRRTLVPLLVVYVVSRILCVYLADHPEHYPGVSPDPDMVYQGWADQVVHEELRPYSEVAIEYPPGSLPFVIGPEYWKTDEQSYRTRFTVLMGIVDAFGLLATLLLARRWRSLWGPWAWTVLIPMVGPIAFARLDLVPAVATLWAIERAAAGSWGGAGAWLGAGTLAKLYPIVFVPAAFLIAANRKRFALGFLLALAIPLLPFITIFDDLWRSVIGYHSARGIQVESFWGSGLLIAMRRGYDAGLGASFGAFHLGGEIGPLLERIAMGLSMVVFAGTTYRISRADRARPDLFARGALAIISLLLAIGTVFSPQFMIWVIAVAAAAACAPAFPKSLLILLAGAAVLTQTIFPFIYGDVIGAKPVAITVLWVRNLLVLNAGIICFGLLRARADEEPAPIPA